MTEFEEKSITFKFEDLFDPGDEFDAWVVCWCVLQQRMLALRGMFLRLNIDNDPYLSDDDANYLRWTHFIVSASFMRDASRLFEARSHFEDQLNATSDPAAVEVTEALEQLGRLIKDQVGEKPAWVATKALRDKIVHVPFDHEKGKPWDVLCEAMTRVGEEGGTHSISSAGTVGTTKISFARHIEGAIAALALDAPSRQDDFEGVEFRKLFKSWSTGLREAIAALDSLTLAVVSFQLARKGVG